MKKYMLFLFSAVLLPDVSMAAASAWETNPHGKVRLIAPYQVAPENGEVTFGFHFVPKPGWFLYWKNPGDAGTPPKFAFKGSRGFRDPKILWPQPKMFVLAGDITEYGYDHEVVYPIQARAVPANGGLLIKAEVSYLTCKESCIPYKYTLRLSVPQGSPPVSDPDIEPLLLRFISLVPSESDEEIVASLRLQKPGPGLAWILLFAFLGGLILNVMPCVLPVLSIKLLGLVQQAGHARWRIVKNALASAAGIIVSFLGLAGVAILARHSGHAAGWGIQFQNPWFVGILMIIVFLFALNLWGAFEIGLPRIFGRFATSYGQGETLTAYFLSGIFATILATPCSAPFLGTAMGFALAQPDTTVLSVFAASGTGMAFPYLLVAVFPWSLRWLPKPGAWMVRLRIFFGFLLAGTAVWLGWVLFQQLKPVKAAEVRVGRHIEWVPFKEGEIPNLIKAGRPVFVDVTADWCVTCKVNERFVLETPEVADEFKKRGVVMMKADWTQQDAAIGDYLKRHGRAGIPFYALYYPHRDPIIFSELLTKKQVIGALEARDLPAGRKDAVK